MQITLGAAFERAQNAERRGDRKAARGIYEDILAAVPDHPGALLCIARQMRASSDLAGARPLLVRAIESARAHRMQTVELWVELARLEEAASQRAAARIAWQSALADTPSHVPALLGAGDAALRDGEFAAADAQFATALAVDAGKSSAWIGLAQARAGQRRFAEAISAQQRALELAPADRATWASSAWIALQMRDFAGAEADCLAGLLGAPDDATLLSLLGQARKRTGAFAKARQAFEAAIASDPADAAARAALGATLLDMGRVDDARAMLEAALGQGAASAEILTNLGLALSTRGDHEAAAGVFARAADMDPGYVPALVHLASCRLYLCEWEELDPLEGRLAATLEDPGADPRFPPFVSLGLHFSASQQLAVARRWSQAMLPPARAPATIHRRSDRLRIGYLSNDFRDHPTGRLMVGLIEAHDRRRVEVFGYSYGAAQDSPLRRRIAAAFDHWRDLRAASDAEMAEAIRADRIDVLIDRKGHTRGGRLAAFARRPASVQLHLMSFPGTLGYDAIDGLIADAVVAPPGDDVHFHERLFRLPRCYFATDGARDVPQPALRSAHGLPDDALVIGCLNQSYKLSREMFAAWMAALRSAPRSVLWLLAGDQATQALLRAEAARQGIAGERLVFAIGVSQEAHLSRIRCMDLAVDTLPCGSHTTGVDSLWAGVPLLTCRGSTFAGRVGASLLTGVGLPDLIASNPEHYRRRLVELVQSPAALRAYAMHLERRSELSLWDTRGYAADLEDLLERAYGEIAASR